MWDKVPKRVRIVEVGPRDGLQNESAPVPTDAKIAFIDRLSDAGLPEIEVSSFVSPKWIPQLVDAEEVFARIRRRPGTAYSALVPNEKGMDRALACRIDRVNLFTAATETFCRKNINCSIAESLERFGPVIDRARREKLPVRAYVSTAFGCPYEGKVDPKAVLSVCRKLLELGVVELGVSDTIGVATPAEIRAVLETLLPEIPAGTIALHLHNTHGTALANILTGLQYGIAAFDSSAGGLGGCPYAPGAAGNVATEDVLYLMHGLGVETGIDPAGVARASDGIAQVLGIPLGAANRWRTRPA